MTSLCVHSNLGGNTINEVALDFWRAGRAREEIPLELLEQRLRLELQEAAGKGWACLGGCGQLLQGCPCAVSHPVCAAQGCAWGNRPSLWGLLTMRAPALVPVSQEAFRPLQP